MSRIDGERCRTWSAASAGSGLKEDVSEASCERRELGVDERLRPVRQMLRTSRDAEPPTGRCGDPTCRSVLFFRRVVLQCSECRGSSLGGCYLCPSLLDYARFAALGTPYAMSDGTSAIPAPQQRVAGAESPHLPGAFQRSEINRNRRGLSGVQFAIEKLSV